MGTGRGVITVMAILLIIGGAIWIIATIVAVRSKERTPSAEGGREHEAGGDEATAEGKTEKGDAPPP